MKTAKLILIGLIAGLAAFIAGSLLYMNPLASGIYAENTFQCSKSMDLFGGTLNWLALMLIGSFVSSIFITWLYSYTEKSIKLEPWKKGIFFGVLLFLTNKLPASYYTGLMYDYPTVLNAIETFNSLIGGLVAGIVISLIYERWK